MAKKTIKPEFTNKPWGFVPTIRTQVIIHALQKTTLRTKTSLINEACEKMEKG